MPSYCQTDIKPFVKLFQVYPNCRRTPVSPCWAPTYLHTSRTLARLFSPVALSPKLLVAENRARPTKLYLYKLYHLESSSREFDFK